MTEGIYLLYSTYPNGEYIYKIGRSKSLQRRLKEYPPNYHQAIILPCDNSDKVERQILSHLNTCLEEGIEKCDIGKEYFKSPTNQIDKIKLKVYDIYSKSLYNPDTKQEPTIELKRCLTDQDCEEFLQIHCDETKHYHFWQFLYELHDLEGKVSITQRVEIINKIYDMRCNHHWFHIMYDDKIIGNVVLTCGFHPRDTLTLHHIIVNEGYRRKGIASKVIQIVEREYFWNKEYYEVSGYCYNHSKELLRKNGFHLNIKFNNIKSHEVIKETYTESVIFRYIKTDDICKSNDESLFEDQIISCRNRSRYINETNDHKELWLELVKPWIQIIKDTDHLFCILIGSEYLIKPTKYKYLNKHDKNFQLIHDSEGIHEGCIARIDTIFLYGKDVDSLRYLEERV